MILILLISACQPAQIETIPVEMPDIIKIGLQPTLAYLKEPISTCANQDSTYDVLLLEKNSYDWIEEPVDAIFTSQHAVEGGDSTYLIDEFNIAIIANPDFPLSHLEANQLQTIFNTEMFSPAQLGLAEDSSITIYGFYTNADIAAMFEYQFGFSPQLPVDAYLAASPQSIVEIIASNSMSIGYTLSPVVDDKVKILNYAGENKTSSIPVIASIKTAPTASQTALISCLQSALIE